MEEVAAAEDRLRGLLDEIKEETATLGKRKPQMHSGPDQIKITWE